MKLIIIIFILCFSVLIVAFGATLLKTRRLIRRHLYPKDESEASIEDVRVLLRAGQRIPAIKLYRKIYGVGLADACNKIDQLAENPPQKP